MRTEDLRAELAAAAAARPDGQRSVASAVQRRWRAARRARIAVALVAVAAVGVGVVAGPEMAPGPQAARTSAPAAPSGGVSGRLVMPGVSAPIAVVGSGVLAVHDPETGDRVVTPVMRLNGATTAATAVALGPWVVVATGGGPGSPAFALDSHDPSATPRRLGPAVTVVGSGTPGLVWLADAGDEARQVTLGGLPAGAPVSLPGPLVGVTDVGLLVQAPTGAAIVDPATGAVVWSADGTTALAAHGRDVAWCRDPCRRVAVTEIGGASTVLAPTPAAVGSYAGPAAFSPDGRWLAVTRGAIVVVHDVTGSRPPAVLSGGGDGTRTFTWAGDWLVFSGGSALETAKAPSFSALSWVEAGTDVRAVVALDGSAEVTGPTLVGGTPYSADGWFVRAGIRTIDTVTDVCFGVFGPPLDECLPAAGGPVEARLTGAGAGRSVVGVVRDRRITQVRVILTGTTTPVVMEAADLVPVQGGSRVFAWRAPPGAGLVNVGGLAADGVFVAGASIPLA